MRPVDIPLFKQQSRMNDVISSNEFIVRSKKGIFFGTVKTGFGINQGSLSLVLQLSLLPFFLVLFL